MQDFRGKQITVGSRIVYPQRFSSNLTMLEAEVLDIGTRSEHGTTVPTLTVKRLREAGLGPTAKEYADAKPSVLTAINRVVVIT